MLQLSHKLWGLVDMIKRFAIILSCFFAFSIFLIGCGNDKNNEIIGDWVPTTATINGTTVHYSSLGLEDDQFFLTFNSNGTCTVVLTGISHNCTYTFNETSIDIIINNEENKLGYEAGIITYSLDYENNPMQISFTKKR